MKYPTQLLSSEETPELAIVLTATYNILFTNDMVLSRISELIGFIKKSKLYRQKVKQTINKLDKHRNRYERMMGEVFGETVYFFSDAVQIIEEELDPCFQELKEHMTEEFTRSNSSEPELMAALELAFFLTDYARVNFDKRIEELRSRHIPDCKNLEYLRSIKDFSPLIRELLHLVYDGNFMDLNNNQSCLLAVRNIERKLTDVQLIARALEEAKGLLDTNEVKEKEEECA